MRTGLGLKAQINLTRVFDRKNYFYPDLPQGYQISPVQEPDRGRGRDLPRHAGRRDHPRRHRAPASGAGRGQEPARPASRSFLRRSQPLRHRADGDRLQAAHALVAKKRPRSCSKLRAIVRYLGTCDGNMDEGSMRADVNVSVCRVGGYEKFRATGDFKHLGTRCEIKNVNSMRFVQQAVEYEARRQVEIIEGGGTIKQETRLFDSQAGRDALHALQGRSARLSLLPRSRSAAAGARAEPGSTRSQSIAARTAGREEGAVHQDSGFRPTTPAFWSAESETRRLFRGDAGGRRGCQRPPPTG